MIQEGEVKEREEKQNKMEQLPEFILLASGWMWWYLVRSDAPKKLFYKTFSLLRTLFYIGRRWRQVSLLLGHNEKRGGRKRRSLHPPQVVRNVYVAVPNTGHACNVRVCPRERSKSSVEGMRT